MDQIKILFTTVQGLKTVTEEEIGVEPNLLPLADRQAVENLEERLRNSPDLKNQLVRTDSTSGFSGTIAVLEYVLNIVFKSFLLQHQEAPFSLYNNKHNNDYHSDPNCI